MYVQEKKNVLKDFNVIKDYGDEETFFRLETPNGEVRLQKLPFQMKLPLPDTLNCRVKGYNGKTLVLGHNMPMYVSEFYADGFSKGEEFEFKVVTKPTSESNFYRIEDENGLQFKLTDTKSPMSVGQKVKCKFEHIDPYVFILRRSASDSQLRMITFREIGRMLNLSHSLTDRLESSVRSLGYAEVGEALAEYDKGMPSWIFTAAKSMRDVLLRWFSSAIGQIPNDTIAKVLTGCRSIMLYMLEGSDFLRNIKGVERTLLQQELTAYIEMLDVYSEALDTLRNHQEKAFLDNLLYHLKVSGYIYHPVAQFTKMTIFFRVNPDLVNHCLGNMFDTLLGWYADTWKDEPFRNAFLDQLQAYISEEKGDIDNFLEPEDKADNQKVEKVLTAIAIQQALTPDDKMCDLRYNLSLFYRCLSLLRSAKAGTLLQKSLLTLMKVKLPIDFTWSEIKEPTMMMTRAAIDPPYNASLPESPVFYLNEKLGVEVEIGKGALTVQRIDDEGAPLIPNGVLPWEGMKIEVNANIDHPFNRQRVKTLEGHAEFWKEVEDSLFHPEEELAETFTRRAPDIDDVVRIIIDRVIPSNTDPNRIEALHCKIVDDHFLEGDGIMLAEDLVSYNLHGVTIGAFRNDDGEPMQFEATVVDIDQNDNPRFSLLEQGRAAIYDLVDSGDDCYAVVTKDNGRAYSAISDRGFGLFVTKDENETMPYRCGNVLHVNITHVSPERVIGEVLEGPIDGKYINNANSLHCLMKAIAVNCPSTSEDMSMTEDGDLERADVRELAQIMRYKAISCSENILDAFDYLSLARILAIIAEDNSLAETLRAQKEILLLHQHYAKNKQVYFEDIDRILGIAPESKLVSRLARRLKIVATLGSNDNNNALWQIANDHNATDLEHELAQMVLSHNLLYDINHEDPTLSTIKDKIAKALNVSAEQRHLKYYGTESQYTEFKSSLVYPAQKRDKGLSMADPDKQEKEILHIIAGFMNSTGGTLFIGVNDDSYERGLDEDLKFYKIDTSDRNTLYRRQIKSLDNMANYLQNLIDRSFNLGTNAGDYAKAFIDDESTKGVIGVKIDPCARVVTLDGTIYVRHSAKTTALRSKTEIEQFEQDRERLYAEQKRASEPEKAASLPVADASPAPQAPAEEAIATEQEAKSIEPVSTLTTSKIRKNILHDFESEHFVTPNFYLRFTGDNDYMLTNDEWSIMDDDRLALTVTNDEADQWLVMVYENEQAVKVPMREIQQKKMNYKHPHYGGAKLLFACPMKAGGGLYSIHTNARGTVYERFTPLDAIATGSMGTAPSRLVDSDCQTWIYESIPPERAAEFESVKSTNLKRSQLGSMAKFDNNTKVLPANAIEALYSKMQ